jgi:hypothetical protein
MQKLLTVFVSAVLFLATTNILATTTKSEPLLGAAYSNDREESLGITCMIPQLFPIHGGSNRSTVDLVKNDSFDSVKRTLHITGEGKVKVGLFEGGTSVDFLRYIEDDNLSISFIYKAQMEFMTDEYYPLGGEALNDLGKQWLSPPNPDGFYNICGNSYVSTIKHGGLLYAVLQFRFKTHTDRERFEAKFKTSFATLGEISGTLVNDIIRSNIQGNIHIFATQEGGDAQKLVQIFAGNPLLPSPISECSLANFGACKQIITNVMNYVSDVNRGFSSQFVIPNPGAPPINAAVSGIDTKPYDPFTKFKVPSYVTPAVVAARNQLGDLFLKTSSQLQRTDYLYGLIDVPYVYELYQEKLDGANDKLTANLSILEDAGKLCFKDSKNCLATRDQALNQLQPIDQAALILPDHFDVIETNDTGTAQRLFVAVDNALPVQAFRGTQTAPSQTGKYDVRVRFSFPNILMTMVDHDTQAVVARYDGTGQNNNNYAGTVKYSSGKTANWTAHFTKSDEMLLSTISD